MTDRLVEIDETEPFRLLEAGVVWQAQSRYGFVEMGTRFLEDTDLLVHGALVLMSGLMLVTEGGNRRAYRPVELRPFPTNASIFARNQSGWDNPLFEGPLDAVLNHLDGLTQDQRADLRLRADDFVLTGEDIEAMLRYHHART